ncbi:MAG: LysM peptidoglycan-binding domain-containing protein, partial [Bacteroidota bacterium]
MGRFLRLSIVATVFLLTTACFLTQCGTNNNNNTAVNSTPTAVSLVVQAQPNTYNAVGQTIAYSYTVTNTGTSRLTGPVSIVDDKAIVVTCPDLKTIGNKNADLDNGESVTCTGGYAISQADINNGSVTNKASATVGGLSSATISTTIQAQLNKVLTLSVTASPTTYNAANQNITFTYVITNTGATTLGPAQFIVNDSRFPNPINCGSNATTLATSQNVTCNAVYTTTSADAGQCQISSTVNASGAGAGTIQPVTVSITNPTGFCGGTPAPNLTPGTTIQITVAPNDWLLQLSRCFGANYANVRSANPQIYDPDVIYPGTPVSIPNIGSAGTIFGPPCVVVTQAASGDTWQTIATKYNAAVDILIAANPGKSVSPGVSIKVPVNSKGYGLNVTPVFTPNIPPTPRPTVTTPIPQTTRLTFPAGNPTSVSQPGTITTPGTIRYVFAGTTGQSVNVRLTVASNDINMGIYGPNNMTLKAPDAVNTYTGTLPLT